MPQARNPLSTSVRNSAPAAAGRLAYYRYLTGRILSASRQHQHHSFEELRLQAREFCWRLKNIERPTQEIVPVFALVSALIDRIYRLMPHPVQVLGAVTMAMGGIAEMQTGEGKTLTSLFPVALRAMSGQGCHVMTVNDYLAARDAEFARPLLNALGLSVAALTNEVERRDRPRCYAADVTYGTEKEFGFDFLKDQLVRAMKELPPGENSQPGPLIGVVQRERHFALIDEADSVLIDQARTPLIIALPADQSAAELALLDWCQQVATRLIDKEHYQYQPKTKSARLTESGCRRIAFSSRPELLKHLSRERIYRQVERAIVAREGFIEDRDFLVIDGKVEIIDEATGRVLPGRKWRDGLQQAIELEAGVEFSENTGTAARMTLQSFLSSYPFLCGMTGTATGIRRELLREYGTTVTTVPPHRRCRRQSFPPRIFTTQAAKMAALAREVQQLLADGQAILIGTSSVLVSEQCAEALRTFGIEASVLHARLHHLEAEIVQLAGQPGRVTVATNMAGRGTDIKIAESVRTAGGLHVICTEMNRSARIDRQLIGRTARQGDPGSFQFFVSFEDPLLEILGEKKLRRIRTLARRFNRQEHHRRGLKWFQLAQKLAERQDAHARKQLVLNERKRDQAFKRFGFDPSVDLLEEDAA